VAAEAVAAEEAAAAAVVNENVTLLSK
jgi:hypothetical protein